MRASSIALIASAALVAAIGAAAKWLSAPPLEDEPEPGRGSRVPRWGDGSNSSAVRRGPAVDTFSKVRPGESVGPDGATADHNGHYHTAHPLVSNLSEIKIRRCAEQIALGGLSPEAQDYLRGFFAGYDPTLNQKINCEGVEVTDAQVGSAREYLEGLLSSIPRSEPTRRDLSLR